jgi:hypothetical protein
MWDLLPFSSETIEKFEVRVLEYISFCLGLRVVFIMDAPPMFILAGLSIDCKNLLLRPIA